MTITVQQATATLENVLFESATFAAANAANVNLSTFANIDAYATSLTSTAEFGIVERVVSYYQDALGRSPSGAEIAFYVNLAENGSTAAGIAAATPAQIAQGATGISNATWSQIATYFSASNEFQTDYGVSANSATPAQYTGLIDALYHNVLGRTPGASEVAYYVAALSAGASPSTLMQWFSASPEFQSDVNSTISSLLVTYNDALQFGGSNAVSIGKIPIGPQPTYTVSHDSQVFVSEGSTETFTVSTSGVASGTTLYYTLSGVTASEISGGSLSGSVAVGADGDATLAVTLTSTAGQGLTGNLTASISTSAGGAALASSSVPLVETAAPGLVTLSTLAGGSSAGLAISNTGEVVGFAGVGGSSTGLFQSRGGPDHAVTWTNGTITDLGLLAGDTQAEAWSINSHGEVVGWSVATRSGGLSGGHAFVVENGVMTDIGTMAGSLSSQARSVNDDGQIVGQSNGVAFLWEPSTPGATTGTFLALGTLGLTYSSATGINAGGEAVGYATSQDGGSYKAFLWAPTAANGAAGTMVDLGAAAGQVNPLAAAINASGVVIGTATATGTSNTVSWEWTPSSAGATTGTMTALTGPTGATQITAAAINSSGQIVGEAMVPVSTNGNTDTLDHAMLWQNGTVVDLNTYLPAGSAWVLNSANAINDRGQIVGSAVEILQGGSVNATYILTLPSASHGAEIALVGVSAAHIG